MQMRPELRRALVKLSVWWDSESPEFKELVARIVASLPGGEDLAEAIGLETPLVGWKELELLAQLLAALQDAGDVWRAALAILYGQWPEPEEDEVEEPVGE